jgi:signal transduction histidine kinase
MAERQEQGGLEREQRIVLPCIPGVSQLHEVGRTARVIGYQGRQAERDIIVELLRDECEDEGWFFHSAAFSSRLAQAAVPVFLEVGWVEGRPYRLREYVLGRPVKHLLSDGPLTEERLVALTRSVAAALKAIHQRGYVHGTLTMDHLRVDRSGVFRMLDAGLCVPIGSLCQEEPNSYSAPELTIGSRYDPAADLYSLGAILLDLAAGYPAQDRSADLGHLELRPALNHLLSSLLGPGEGRPSATSVLEALLNLEARGAALRLKLPLPPLATKEAPHPYPLCGREQEFQLLEEAWTQSQAHPLELYLVGPSGCGRSRLAEELSRGLVFSDRNLLTVEDYGAQRADPNGQASGLTLVRAQPEDPIPGEAQKIHLETLDPSVAVRLAEAFLNARAPQSLVNEMKKRRWFAQDLLDQLDLWSRQGLLRPAWGQWSFGDEPVTYAEPLRLTADCPSLEENAVGLFAICLQELQSASMDPVDQLQALTRGLNRVIPCTRSAAWVALEQGLTAVSGSPDPQDLDLIAQALAKGYMRHTVDPYACLALPLLEGTEVLGGVILVRANPFLGAEIDLAEALGRQTKQELRRARLFGEQQRLLELSRHRFLTAQIRPHFLFNALNTLASLIPVEPELAESLTLDTAEFLRTTFADRPDRVSLVEELHLVEVYLRLEKARFGKRLTVDFQIEPGANSVLLPTLTLQPLVENAVRHGVTCRAEGGRITLGVQRCEGAFEIRVEDDGVGFEPSRMRPKGTGVGLSNVRERLIDLYGPAVRWTLRSAPGQGTSISFRVPSE